MDGSEKKMTGIQKVVLAGFIGLGKGFIESYSTLSKEEKKEFNRKMAERMLDKAMQNKLTEPYDKLEVEFIRENLGIHT